MINKLLVTLTSIKGFIFFVIGVLWVVSPYDTGANFGIFGYMDQQLLKSFRKALNSPKKIVIIMS